MDQKIADFFNSNFEKYDSWVGSSEWDEHYKWDVLPRLAEELSKFEKADEDSIDEIVSIYKRLNPSEGSFVRYTYFSDLELGLVNNKSAVAEFMNAVWSQNYSAADTVFRTFAYNNRSLGTPGIGYFAAGRNPKQLPLFRGEFLDGLIKTLNLEFQGNSNAEKYEYYCKAINIIAELIVPKLRESGITPGITDYPAICAQDFLYFKFFNWSDKRLLFNLQQFVNQADRNMTVSAKEADLTRKKYEMQYDNLKITASFGQGAVSRVPWLGISFGSEYGFFPTFLYYVENKTLVLAFDHSEEKAPRYRWRDIESYPTTESFFASKNQSAYKFTQSRVFKSYDTTHPLPDELMEDVHEIIRLYKQRLEEVQSDTSDENILSLVQKFIAHSDEGKTTRNEFRVDYKDLKGRAWFTVGYGKRMETTWFIFGQDNNERSGPWTDPRFGFLYNVDATTLHLAHNWKSKDRQTLGDLGNETWKEWSIYKTYDPHNLPDTLVQDFETLLEEYKEQDMTPDNTPATSPLALNTILYGPPGTGKTYNAINKFAAELLSSQAGQEVPAEEVLADSLKNLNWWQVAAVALYANPDRAYKIREMLELMPIKSFMRYVRQRTDGGYGTLATVLIERSDAASSNYASKVDGQEYFHKNENAEWSLTLEGKALVETELRDIPVTAEALSTSDWKKYYRTITFHQSYSYEEFVEGIRPKLDGDAGSIAYEIKDGIFKEMCELASNDPSNKYLLIIDEINRGNIAKIFGELITLLEDGKRENMSVQLPYSQKSFTVPKNLYVLGTMNTADRSIALLDIALRRRFEFVELMPEPELLSKDAANTGLDLSLLLQQLNQKISIMIDQDHQIGHSYLMDISTVEDIETAWYKKVVPLVQEYFYNDWEKLGIILGKYSTNGTGFIRSDTLKFPGASDLDDTTLYSIHKYNSNELVKALKALVVNEEAPDSNPV